MSTLLIKKSILCDQWKAIKIWSNETVEFRMFYPIPIDVSWVPLLNRNQWSWLTMQQVECSIWYHPEWWNSSKLTMQSLGLHNAHDTSYAHWIKVDPDIGSDKFSISNFQCIISIFNQSPVLPLSSSESLMFISVGIWEIFKFETGQFFVDRPVHHK